ncbi:transposase [Nocardia jiangxiensis]|uniref:transposase n=1 Tax=Nocardia jiangxiensis TaxID=282685 RepID=UPI00030B1436|nr:transposase [Nocardia jiangxiensis]
MDLERINGMVAQRKYPVELRERAVRMVQDLQRAPGGGRGAISQVARDLGIHKEALRTWMRLDEQGKRPAGEVGEGTPADKDATITQLQQRVRELERANSILRAASAFFAREMDPPPPKW